MKPYGGMDGSNTALVVIDMVNSCCHENCEEPQRGITYRKIRTMTPALVDAIQQFKARVGGKVIYTNLTPWTKENLPDNLNDLYEDPNAIFYGDGSDFENAFYGVRPTMDDVVVTKNTYDAFSSPEFIAALAKHGIRYLVMAGVFTDGCVLATIASGFSRGYRFIVLKDLIETTDLPTRQALSELLKGYTFPVLYGRTMEVKEFLQHWN